MKDNSEWAIVVPAHNSSKIIKQTLEELAQHFREMRIKGQVIVVENGSIDNTWELLRSIDSSELPYELICRQSIKGLGNAIREGLKQVSTEFVLVTADDLPFGFSDFFAFMEYGMDADVAIGSKAHPLTVGSRNSSREIMSKAFQVLRRIIIDVNLGDTQGTILGDAKVICDLGRVTKQEGYLMTTELLAFAMKHQKNVVELPVEYRESLRKSNIKVVRDSIKMLRGLFQVRRNLQVATIR